jgi:hypothetical protein
MPTSVSALICGYQNWFEQFAADGRSIWFGTVQFNALRGTERIVTSIMRDEVHCIYTTMLTNIYRSPPKDAERRFTGINRLP